MHTHKILNFPAQDHNLKKHLVENLKISRLLAQILINRQITGLSEAKDFLVPDIKCMRNPFLFADMKKAVERIKQSAKSKERVLIFGDYDVDGITSVAVLKSALDKLRIDSLIYIPDRIKEGYGLVSSIAKKAKAQGIGLLITADCGISNRNEVEELRKNGIDTIITDHHQPHGEDLPRAFAIINPKVNNSGYPFRELAGVGVAHKLCYALLGEKSLEDLDLVALGTIADVVPLTGENRIIVREGLKFLPKSKRPGLRALLEKSGIKNKKISTTFVSFILAPRLNAAGRMDSAQLALDLLLSREDAKAFKIAEMLESHNRLRQRIENKIMDEALAVIDKEVNFQDHKVIVVAKENWHHGVLGIVASKLADRFYRPAIVISLGEDLCKGSGRSIKNFHLFKALKECKDFLRTFGGHAHAAGLTITQDSIKDFKESINRLAHDQLKFEDLLPSLDIDLEANLSELDLESIAELEKLEPFGAFNPEPLFYTPKLRIKGELRDLARDTIKFWVNDGINTLEVIGFGMSSLKSSLRAAKEFSLIYTPRVDNWLNRSSVILEAKDILF